MVEASRHGDDPLSARAAFDRIADQRSSVGRVAMVLEIVAIAVVERREIDVLRRGEPAPSLVVDKQAADAPQRRFAAIDDILKFRDRGRVGPVRLQSVDEAADQAVGQLESVLGMLRERAGKVGHVHFGIFQGGIPQRPLAPAAEGENGDADQNHERCRDEGKTLEAGVASAEADLQFLQRDERSYGPRQRRRSSCVVTPSQFPGGATDPTKPSASCVSESIRPCLRQGNSNICASWRAWATAKAMASHASIPCRHRLRRSARTPLHQARAMEDDSLVSELECR